jgi:hypothetical protein
LAQARTSSPQAVIVLHAISSAQHVASSSLVAAQSVLHSAVVEEVAPGAA